MGGKLSAYLFGYEEIRAIILGLDAAGKTTLLYQMKLGEIVTTIPTIGFNVESIQHGKLTVNAWDIGGRSPNRPLMRHYFRNTQALVFVVDSCDQERMSEVRDDLQSLLGEDELRDVFILVLANKQDLKGALPVEEVSRRIAFEKATRSRVAAIFPISAKAKTGITEAFDWLEGVITSQRRETYLTQRVISKLTCSAFSKAWSVNSLLKTSVSAAKATLSGWSRQKEEKEALQGS